MKLKRESLFPVYQPILDIKQQRLVGYEALIRSDEGVSPPQLFWQAKMLGRQLEFDRTCRTLALECFGEMGGDGSSPMLFLNIDVSALDDCQSLEGWISEQVLTSGLSSRQIALEIVEANVESTRKLIDFVDRYRRAGFLIVIDDFGQSHSNLNRVVQLKPDIIKVDKALIRDIDRDYYKRSIVQSITNLSNKVGAMILAEGVETKEEFFACYALGIQLFQGYFFDRPMRVEDMATANCKEQMKLLMPELNRFIADQLQRDRSSRTRFEMLSMKIIDQLLSASSKFEDILYQVIESYSQIDAIYILDEDGIQISETACRICSGNMHALFAPSCLTADHSLKEYYYHLKGLNSDRYISEPYISRATGNLCRTVSSRFYNCGQTKVLCVDFLFSESEGEQWQGRDETDAGQLALLGYA